MFGLGRFLYKVGKRWLIIEALVMPFSGSATASGHRVDALNLALICAYGPGSFYM